MRAFKNLNDSGLVSLRQKHDSMKTTFTY